MSSQTVTSIGPLSAPGLGASAPGSGATLQLAAVGTQDLYLRCREGRCYSFMTAFRRATRFAMWTDEVGIEYTPGTRSSVDIPKSGDLLADMYLEITLPAVPGSTAFWSPSVGYTFLKRVRLLLNDAEIHNYERLWYDLYDTLYTSSGHEAGLADMVGRAPLPLSKSHVLHIPLRMLTGRRGASRPPLPLQAIPRASLKLDVDWEKPSVLTRQADGTTALTTDPGIKVKLLCDYVELDEKEKKSVLRGTTLAFESAIDSDAVSYVVDSDAALRDVPVIKVNLSNVRFATKMLVWVAYTEIAGGPLFTYLPNALGRIALLFNNQERMAPRPAAYYAAVQPYQHCTRSPIDGPGVYSFALNATSRRASGTADFGALSSSVLVAEVLPTAPRFKLKVFSVYYNFLEIQGASGRLLLV